MKIGNAACSADGFEAAQVAKVRKVLQALDPTSDAQQAVLTPPLIDRMTRSELIARLAAHFPQLTTKDAELAVKAILEG
jgi:hypothetical protein